MGTRHFRKVVFRLKLFSCMQSFIAIQLIRGCENMFSLVSLSKLKIFTGVALVSFVQHSCYTRVVPVLLFCASVFIVSLVSRSCRLCCTSVARVQQTRSLGIVTLHGMFPSLFSAIITSHYQSQRSKHIALLYVTYQRKKLICYNISY